MSVGLVPSMYLYLIEGSVITVANSILLACILGKKKNRERREFLLIGVGALADTIYAISFMLMAEYRLELVAEGRVNGTSTVWQCAKLVALPLHDWATPLLGLLPLTTSLNFLACSTFPLWYLRQGFNYTTGILIAPHFVSLLLLIINYCLVWNDPTPMPALCVAAKGAAHPVVYESMLGIRIVTHLLSAIIYAAILVYLKRAQQTGGLQDLSVQQRKSHRNATITLGCVTLNSFLLLLIPDLLLSFNPGNISQNYSTLLYSMTLNKTMINFFIYMWRYKELKDMMWAMTCRRVPQLKKYFPERISRTSVAPAMSDHRNGSKASVWAISTGRRFSRFHKSDGPSTSEASAHRLHVIQEECEEPYKYEDNRKEQPYKTESLKCEVTPPQDSESGFISHPDHSDWTLVENEEINEESESEKDGERISMPLKGASQEEGYTEGNSRRRLESPRISLTELSIPHNSIVLDVSRFWYNI